MTPTLLFKQFAEEKMGDLHIQYSAFKGEKTLIAEIYGRNGKTITDMIDVPAYQLKAEVFQVTGAEYNRVCDIDFGYLALRTHEIRFYINSLCRSTNHYETLDDLFNAIRKLATNRQIDFKREAVKLLKKKIGFFGFDPFDDELRNKFVEMGLLEATPAQEDEEEDDL